MNPIAELIAQWRAKEVSGTALMRGLVSFPKWEVPISESAAAEALASNSAPSIQLSTSKEGATCLLVFSCSETHAAYRKIIGATGSQDFLEVSGAWVFNLPMENIDELWIDALSPHDIYYRKEQLNSLHDMAKAFRVEEALVGLRKGNAADDAIQTAREYKNYYLPVSVCDEKPAFILAPDNRGRKLAAAFTSDDTFDAFVPAAKELANGAEVQQMQIDGEALFDTFQRMNIEGFVFNCAGPVPPVAFQQAVAGIILGG